MIKKYIFKEGEMGREGAGERIWVKEYWNYWSFGGQPFCKSEISSIVKVKRMKKGFSQ